VLNRASILLFFRFSFFSQSLVKWGFKGLCEERKIGERQRAAELWLRVKDG